MILSCGSVGGMSCACASEEGAYLGNVLGTALLSPWTSCVSSDWSEDLSIGWTCSDSTHADTLGECAV